jgi:hypothetical protein
MVISMLAGMGGAPCLIGRLLPRDLGRIGSVARGLRKLEHGDLGDIPPKRRDEQEGASPSASGHWRSTRISLPRTLGSALQNILLAAMTRPRRMS